MAKADAQQQSSGNFPGGYGMPGPKPGMESYGSMLGQAKAATPGGYGTGMLAGSGNEASSFGPSQNYGMQSPMAPQQNMWQMLMNRFAQQQPMPMGQYGQQVNRPAMPQQNVRPMGPMNASPMNPSDQQGMIANMMARRQNPNAQ